MLHSVQGTPAFMAPELFKLGGGDDLNEDLPPNAAAAAAADGAAGTDVELEAFQDDGLYDYSRTRTSTSCRVWYRAAPPRQQRSSQHAHTPRPHSWWRVCERRLSRPAPHADR